MSNENRDILEMLEEAQDSIQDGLNVLEQAMRAIKGKGNPALNSLLERFKAYGFAQLQTGFQDETRYVGKSSCSLEKFSREVSNLLDGDDDEEEE